MTTHQVGYLIGSLAKNSINRKLAKALVQLAPPQLQMREISCLITDEFLRNYMSEFATFLARVLRVLPRDA
jgi:chromate reductase, NAD(P)H dehydrogenase (quinone)